MLINPQTADGTLTITYNPKNQSLTTKTTRKTDASAEIVTTKEYGATSSTQPQSMIELSGTKSATEVDIYAPTVNLTYDPTKGFKENGIINPVVISYTHPLTGEILTADSKISFDQNTKTYRIVGEFKNDVAQPFAATRAWVLSQFPEEKQQKQVAAILDQIEPFLSGYPAEAYKQIINNLDSILSSTAKASHTNAAVAAIIKPLITNDTYQQIKEYLLMPVPTSIQTVVVEFNPVTNQIATRTIKRMSEGMPTQTTLEYPVS